MSEILFYILNLSLSLTQTKIHSLSLSPLYFPIFLPLSHIHTLAQHALSLSLDCVYVFKPE